MLTYTKVVFKLYLDMGNALNECDHLNQETILTNLEIYIKLCGQFDCNAFCLKNKKRYHDKHLFFVENKKCLWILNVSLLHQLFSKNHA